MCMLLSFSLDVVLQGQRSEVEAMITDMGVVSLLLNSCPYTASHLKSKFYFPANTHTLTADT